MSSKGILQVCATPIGNLGDITLRVLDALKEADVIAAEDTRVTRKLLSRYDVHTPLESYHAKNLEKRTPALVARIAGGARVALVSDAGTPGISDPGAQLVDACLEADLKVDVLPGPSAILTALVASGLPTHAFYFGGFLPRRPGPMRRAIEAVAGLEATLVFYESPKRAVKTLDVLADVLGGREAAMARELTKMHEEVIRGGLRGLAERLGDRELRGEVVLLVGPPERGVAAEVDDEVILTKVRELEDNGISTRDAVRAASEALGVSRNKVYRLTVDECDGKLD